MKDVEIKGLEVTACHGVLGSEKKNPQPFVFDISLDCDTETAAKGDDLSKTVNYAEVCALADSFCRHNSFNLIESLAYGAAFSIAEKFGCIKAAEVVVHKPQAPVGFPFSDVCVKARVERNAVVLSLGSSEGDKAANLNGAVNALSRVRGIKILKVSDFIETKPYGGAAKNTFLNGALTAECLLSPRELLDEIHKTEKQFGRVRKERWGDRTLDIDIVFFGNKIIEEYGLCVPHPDYINRDFVLIPVKQIAGDFVCPLRHKRVFEL